MNQAHSIIGFAVIVVLYLVIGLLTAMGTIFAARKLFSSKAEQVFYAMFLVMIASFYLAFAAYFGASGAWRLETAAVLAFAVAGLLGARFPLVLMLGYSLHGLWDMLHELPVHGVDFSFRPGQLTAVPLAYGFFCAAFDVAMALYVYAQRSQWSADWRNLPE